MIKRIRFATRGPGITVTAFTGAWPGAVAGASLAPSAVRPLRVAACLALPGRNGPGARHDGTGVEWFADDGHLALFEEWLASPDAARYTRDVGSLIEPGASPMLIAEESVLRGEQWLDRRWQVGGPRLKHLAVAVRAAGLTVDEFSRRWRDHAGQARTAGAAQATVIPDTARGSAYVQNHPVPRASGEWAYDALSEVYFDDLAGLRTRIEWFEKNIPEPADGDMFGQSWFIAAREVALA